MTELEFEAMVDKAIEECMWKQEAADIILCRAECLPCKRCIDVGRCDTIKDLIKNVKKEDE